MALGLGVSPDTRRGGGVGAIRQRLGDVGTPFRISALSSMRFARVEQWWQRVDNDPARRIGRRLLRGAGFGLLGVTALLGLLAMMALENQPALPLGGVLAPVAPNAGKMLREKLKTADTDATEKRIVLTASDLEAAAHLAISRKRMNGAVRARIQAGRLNVEASFELRDHFPRLYLNLALIADHGAEQATLRRLRVGDISVPYPLNEWLLKSALSVPPLSHYGPLLTGLIRRVEILDDRMAVNIRWHRELLGELSLPLMDTADRERLIAYQQRLTEVLNGIPSIRFVRLTTLMQPLFALARDRSAANGQATDENRAAILVLTAYANGRVLAAALGLEAQPPRRGVLLGRRVDTAKHFLGAATMAMSGQGTLVEMIGLAKELHDTHDGSGFSFVDLAADEAGALFGKSAVRNLEKANRIQQQIGQKADESLFMPSTRDLPESMDAESFASRFKAIDSPEYRAMQSEISRRIKALPLFR